MMKKTIGIFFLLTLVLAACKKGTYDVGTTATPKTSNGWWVNYSVGGTPLLGAPVLLSTYNTAANTTDSIWVDDLKNFWTFKGKFKLNYSSLTFGSANSDNQYYPSQANITNGKVLLKAGHSRAGNPTDSIYFEITFSDDSPANGTTYVVTGTARTGFIEDDY